MTDRSPDTGESVTAEARSAEWDASAYHRVANPHVTWGQRVLARLHLRGDERILDAGCGTGRLTAELLGRLPNGRVLAVDISENMLAVAREHLAPRFGSQVTFLCANLQDLTLAEPVDAIFSTAALHWVPDHARLFRHLHGALRPGGWLVAQCGGGPNIKLLVDRSEALMRQTPYAESFGMWRGPWEFADAETTAHRLEEAGFVDVETSLESAPTVLGSRDEYREFLRAVVFGEHLARLPTDALRLSFVETLAEQGAADDPPYLRDYWRLNLCARRAPHTDSPER
ncbi:MAG: methyltransferase domain-containing protein [Chloroflexi bacterium]|nr:methyltransferase domain-containing protein [Chloroflexota bacterium]